MREWKRIWDCKIQQPKALWIFKWLDFYENNDDADKGKVLASDAADWLVEMNEDVDRDEFIENLLEGKDMKKKKANRINFTRFWRSLPKAVKSDEYLMLHKEVDTLEDEMTATEKLAEQIAAEVAEEIAAEVAEDVAE